MNKFILLFVCCLAISLTYARPLSQSNLQTENETIYLEAQTCTIWNPEAEPNKWGLHAWSGNYRFDLTWISETLTGVFDKEDLAAGIYVNYIWQYDEGANKVLTKYTFEEIELVVAYEPLSGLIQQLNIDAKIKAVDKQGNVAYFTIHADREDLFARDTVQLEVPNAGVYEILGDSAFVMQGETADGTLVSVSLLSTNFPGEGYYLSYFNRPMTFVEYRKDGDTVRYEAIKDDQGLAADVDNADAKQVGKVFDLDARFLAADTVLYMVKMHHELPAPKDTVEIEINNMLIDDSNAADGGGYYVDGYTDNYHVELLTRTISGTHESPNIAASIQRLTYDNQANLMEMWGKVKYTTKGDSTTVYAEVIANDHVLYKINMCSSYRQSLLLLDVDVDNTCSTMGSVIGTGVFAFGEKCQIQAIPNSDYRFTQWNDGNTENPRMFFITKNTTFIAFFAPDQYSLTTRSNGEEYGTTQGDTIADYLTNVQISATANYGYHFTQWSDGNTNNPRTISLTKDTNLVAQFEKNQYTITTTCNAEQGTISGTQEAEYLDEVTISATANYGYHFTQWSDGNTDNPRTFTLTQDTAFAAEFAPNQYTLTTTTNYAERGTAQGDTIADYLTEIQVSATANYGYHFTQWSDGNTDNPRTISLTKNTNLVALFEKNQYTITTTCNAEQGTILGTQVAEYLDEITLNVLPNVGWHFTQWTDSNTDNPRTFTLTQDTTFASEFAMDYSGKCGDDLYWAYNNQEIKITGTGAMYNYTDSTMPWTLLRDSIKTVRVGNNATSIGEYAFANTPKLAELHIGTNVEDIGANAFAGCRRLYDIYCYATNPPFAETNSFANYNVYVHVPCASFDAYDMDVVFGSFKYVECIGAEDTVITDKTVTVVPGDADATFTWPVTDNADTYSLVITKDGVTFCTLVFNAQGQLVSIAFKPRRQNAPAAEGTTPATYAEMTANGFRFTVTGLDEGTAYAYTLTVRNAANTVLETYTGDFTTLSNTPTGINESTSTGRGAAGQVEKLLHNGQVLILRNGETYDMMGQRL